MPVQVERQPVPEQYQNILDARAQEASDYRELTKVLKSHGDKPMICKLAQTLINTYVTFIQLDGALDDVYKDTKLDMTSALEVVTNYRNRMYRDVIVPKSAHLERLLAMF